MDSDTIAGTKKEMPENLTTSVRKLEDGKTTTIYVAEYDLLEYGLRVESFAEQIPLLDWCIENDETEAIIGAFFINKFREEYGYDMIGVSLGEIRKDGSPVYSAPFDEPWGSIRACVHIEDSQVSIRRRDEIERNPEGDLLQAGPLLVQNGQLVDKKPEGFSEGSRQFDSDITVGRHARAAIGIKGNTLYSFACDARTDLDAGLELEEVAEIMLELGCDQAMNLDGGGSTSLICGGELRNIPRQIRAADISRGRPISSAIVISKKK